ncbi:MAG: argininosuccinate lyase [Chloroflexota bacterium]
MTKLWGGRFSSQTDILAAQLNASIAFDWRLAPFDVRASSIWAEELAEIGLLSSEEHQQIQRGLEQISSEIQDQSFQIKPDDEDVHTAIERRLFELIGEPAGKLHTGRSRNDQVMTDFLLWLREAGGILENALREVQQALIDRAETDLGLMIPGYTHLQRAQPILLSHWWLSHFYPLQRDRQYLAFLLKQANLCPLGSSALAGCPYPINRFRLAQKLGFDAPIPNSIDAVSSRDAAASFLFLASLVSVHLSRLAEALILFSTTEFGFVELPDAYTTGSSIMPQKKNPDMLELTRAKAGTTIGKLTGFLSVLKNLPSAYDKDLQEDKPAVFSTFDSLSLILPVISGILRSLVVNPSKLSAGLDSTLLATEIADFLVLQGIPFRKAHHLVGELVKECANQGITLLQVSAERLAKIHERLPGQLNRLLDPHLAVERRSQFGGTSSESVKTQIVQAREMLHKLY